MKSTYSPEMQQQLKDSVELLRTILGSDLLGVYLYGSSLVGGLQKYSDIDLFAVTNRATTSEEKSKLIAKLLQISGLYMKSSKRPLEITLVEKRMINPWQYPPHFDFQYGEYLRDSFEKGIIEPWENYEMPDLAVLVTQVLLGSETLWGLKPSQLLVEVPYRDFMKAMIHDVNRLVADLEHDTRNVLLTFARIWSTLETDTIRSKPAAADWVINRLPEGYQPVMKRAKSICIGLENEHWDDIKVFIKPCADYMVDKINGRIPVVNFNDPNKRINLYENEKSHCLIDQHCKCPSFHFKPAKSSQRVLLHQWFEQKHIKEWMHGVGLQNTLNGLEMFFQGESSTIYWIGYDKDIPFAFLITSPEGNDATTLDLFICDLNYLGKGIAVPMIREFLMTHFPNMKRVLIDPEATNKRAIHVYQKVGFKIIGEFIASWHPVLHYQMELYMKDLLETNK